MARRNVCRVVIVVTVVFLLCQLCYGSVKDDSDFQYWGTAKARFDINKDWYGTVAEEFRIGDDAERLYYRHTDLGFVTSPADWLDLEIFGAAWLKPVTDVHFENNPCFDW